MAQDAILFDIQARVKAGIQHDVSKTVHVWGWKVWPRLGKCGEYAKIYAAELASAGVDRSHMAYLVGTLADGRRHAALLVDGKWQMDARNRVPVAFKKSEWRYID